MSSTNNDSNNASVTPAKPSDKQINLLAVIMQNVQGKPDINWSNVATQSGLKNERTAKEMYRQMTKKFGWGGMGARSPTGPATGNAAATTPTKVRKRTGKVGTKSDKKVEDKKIKQEEQDDDEESGRDCV